MNKNILAKGAAVISALALLLTGCSQSHSSEEVPTETSAAEITSYSETASETVSETLSETAFSEAADEEAETTEISAEQPAAAESLELDHFENSFDFTDYGERFCGWKYDYSAVIQSESEYYLRGGKAEVLSAAEKAVRESEEFNQVYRITETAELGSDGAFRYEWESDVKRLYNMASDLVDENGRANVIFNSAVLGDFDGDGKDETFLLMTIPSFDWLGDTLDCAVFVNSDGKAQFLCSGVSGYLHLIRYNNFMHVYFAFGVNNLSHFAEIYAVEGGKAALKHSSFAPGIQSGIAILESMAQAPGSWLVVWDNIDKIYKYVAPVKAPADLVQSIFDSPFMETIEDKLGTEVSSPDELTFSVFGGKYVSVGTNMWNFVTLVYEYGSLSVTNERIISYHDEAKPSIALNLDEAEKLGELAPIPEYTGVYAHYELSSDAVYAAKDRFISAAGESTLSAAEKAVKDSREYKLISYQLKSIEKNGNKYTVKDRPDESFVWDDAFFVGDAVTPLFRSGVYDDFDGDGKKEGFLLFALPLVGERYIGEDASVNEQNLLIFVSSDGKAQRVDMDSYWLIDEMSIIRYENEAHLLIGSQDTILSVRDGVPVFELFGAVPSGDGASFSGDVYYDPILKEYCFAKVRLLNNEMLQKLGGSAEFKAAFPDRTVEKAYTANNRLVMTEDYLGTWLWDGTDFHKTQSKFYYDSYRNHDSEYLSFDITLLPLADKDTEFFDYKLIEDYPESVIPEDMKEKAVKLLTDSEYYDEAMKYIDQYSEIAELEKYIEDGAIKPQFHKGWVSDFDGDGREEAFLLVNMPIYDNPVMEWSFLIFSGSDGRMEILDYMSGLYPVTLLDYGDFKHISFGGSGSCGAEDHKILYGVFGAQARKLYAMRGGYTKFGCFLSTYGWQGSGSTMFFDTKRQRYVSIVGEAVPINEFKALDKDNILSKYDEILSGSEYENSNFIRVRRFGSRYYVLTQGMMDSGTVFVYEDGRLKAAPDISIRVCRDSTVEQFDAVANVDIDWAIKNCKK